MRAMTTNLQTESSRTLVRTSVLVSADTDQALRALAARSHRPLSWEIRLALEAHVQQHAPESAAA